MKLMQIIACSITITWIKIIQKMTKIGILANCGFSQSKSSICINLVQFNFFWFVFGVLEWFRKPVQILKIIPKSNISPGFRNSLRILKYLQINKPMRILKKVRDIKLCMPIRMLMEGWTIKLDEQIRMLEKGRPIKFNNPVQMFEECWSIYLVFPINDTKEVSCIKLSGPIGSLNVLERAWGVPSDLY